MSNVSQLILLIRYIRDNVDCYSMPIDKIIESCRDDILLNLETEKKSIDLLKLYDELEKKCDDESKRIFKEFTRDFGKGYREHQLKICDVAISAFEKHLSALESTYPVRKKRIATLCFSLGGMILIALL